jgi:hypothetical protein
LSKLPTRGKPCPDCGQPVPDKARVCPTCKVFLDWRRVVGIGHTNLVLLVALFSVLTTLITVGIPFFKTPGADLRFIFESGDLEEVRFLARNDGRSSGVVHVFDIQIFVKDGGFLNVNVDHDGTQVAPGSEVRLTAKYSADVQARLIHFFTNSRTVKGIFSATENSPNDIIARIYKMSGERDIVCTVHFSYRSFYSPRVTWVQETECSDLFVVNEALRKTAAAFVKF